MEVRERRRLQLIGGGVSNTHGGGGGGVVQQGADAAGNVGGENAARLPNRFLEINADPGARACCAANKHSRGKYGVCDDFV